MAYNVTTSLTTLTKLGKHIQGSALKVFAKRSEEFNLWKSLKDFELRPSQRDVTCIVDVTPARMGSFITEGGYETLPTTIDPQELTFTWAQYNDRYGFTMTSKYLDKRYSDAMIIKQSQWQTMKLMEGLVKRVGLAFYGVSTGVLAQVGNEASQTSGTYALKNGFGRPEIDNTTYLAQIFGVGDRVALVRSGALVANSAGGEVTASSTSGIAITWGAAVDSADEDNVVLCNSSGPNLTTGALVHSDYNHAPNGLLDFTHTALIHGLNSGTYTTWAPALVDSAGSLLTGTRLMKGQHAIKFAGGGKANLLIMAPGVFRSVYQSTSSAVQFADPLGMEIIGSIKTGGIQQHYLSPLIPPGYAWLMDKSDFYKWALTPIPGEDDKSLDGYNTNEDKLQDINAMVASFDFLWANVCKKRASLAAWYGLDEV